MLRSEKHAVFIDMQKGETAAPSEATESGPGLSPSTTGATNTGVSAMELTSEMPLQPEAAKARMVELGVNVFYEKVLTTSDTSGSGRIVIPKGVAEANFPTIEVQNGINLQLTDAVGRKYTTRYRFWINNASRMYLVEGTQQLQREGRLSVGDVLMFGRHPQTGVYYVCGRKGSPGETSRRPPTKRLESMRKRKSSTDSAGTNIKQEKQEGGRGPIPTAAQDFSDTIVQASNDEPSTANVMPIQPPSGDGSRAVPPKPKRWQQRQQDQNTTEDKVVKKPQQTRGSTPSRNTGVNNNTEGSLPVPVSDVAGAYNYWNAMSLPVRADGVFRAMPGSKGRDSERDVNRVVAQHGKWTAIVKLVGEAYQAFFESREAAVAAFEAAVQTGL